MANGVNRLKRAIIGRIKKRVLLTKDFTYQHDGLFTYHNCDFVRDPRFAKAYGLGKATGSWGNSELEWRVYVACWAAEKGASLEGDFVECGVNRGGISRAVMEYVNFQRMADRKFYLLDTYKGLPEQDKPMASVDSYLDFYSECYEDVVKTFAEFPNAIVVRGMVPETLAEVKSEKVCYLSVDMNNPKPEIAALNFFWDKLTSGAVVVLDDYGYANAHNRQKAEIDQFTRSHGVSVLTMPTGQGLIVKP